MVTEREGVAHRAHDPGCPGKSCRAAGIQPQRREGLLMAAQGLASQVGVAPACGALGPCHGRPSTVVTRPLPDTSSPVPRPPGRCESPNASTCPTCSPPHASSTVHPLRSSPRCSTKANTCARSARCIGSWLRISRCENGAINSSTPYTKPELVATGPEPDVVVGHHTIAGAETLDLLLPLRPTRYLQPLRAHTVLQQRAQTLHAAWSHHPERFVRGIPKPPPLPEAVRINPPATYTTGETVQ